ncbi:glycosyl transferase family 1 [Paracoccus sp. (in: a-proteobacteria)]|uniref:glycosyl transferase family 1 n=1 Tax=Paracoccus sp. TaxID=267 RepID=UPI00396D0110
MLRILYLAHDLRDAAVKRRLDMLMIGGARVSVAGFRRDERPIENVGVHPAVDLGRTYDRDFKQRVAKIISLRLLPQKNFTHTDADIVIARNLEMLVLAMKLRRHDGKRPKVVYESLDVHRLLLRKDAIGKVLRRMERHLLSDVPLIMTSSPAFVREYFNGVQGLRKPVVLIENKVLDVTGDQTAAGSRSLALKPDGEPVRIGWFGALRCRKSVHLLAEFSRRMHGRYEIVLRGRPARTEFDDFDGFVAAEPFMRFEGPYRSPDDLATIYGEVDYVWAIDFFEEGLNSSWLLPNRLYEGCLHGGVPIAIAGTETARYLAENKIGEVLLEASPEALCDLLEASDLAARQREVVAKAIASPPAFICGQAECERLVDILQAGESIGDVRAAEIVLRI